jgi:DNA-binding NtrC family response regulator
MRPDRVLLVDDEVEFVETLAERMRARGLEVETAYNGVDALIATEQRGFDAVVLDLAMPGLDGIQTLRRMREINPDLQVMLLSGQATVQAAAEATRLGAVDIFEKPTDVVTLVARIREARAARIRLEEERSQEEIDDILSRRGW